MKLLLVTVKRSWVVVKLSRQHHLWHTSLGSQWGSESEAFRILSTDMSCCSTAHFLNPLFPCFLQQCQYQEEVLRRGAWLLVIPCPPLFPPVNPKTGDRQWLTDKPVVKDNVSCSFWQIEAFAPIDIVAQSFQFRAHYSDFKDSLHGGHSKGDSTND